jgi:hypothetical protein
VPAPGHPHLVRHARVRQLVRQTRSLPLAQRQAGWSRLQLASLPLGDDEARELMRRAEAERGGRRPPPPGAWGPWG